MSHVSSLRSGSSGYAAASRLLSSIRSLLASAADSHGDANGKLLFALSTTTRSTKTCTKRLRVELTENVDGLGAAGESVLVPSGYARNFLVPNRLARIQVGSDAAEDGKRRRGLSFAATKYSELSGKGTGAGAGTATGAGPGTGPGPGTGAGARQQQQQQQQQQASADDRDYSLLISSPSTSVRPNRLSISDIDGDSRSSW